MADIRKFIQCRLHVRLALRAHQRLKRPNEGHRRVNPLQASILYNLKNIARFSGRDSRARFWPSAIFLFVIQCIVYVLIVIPGMVTTMTRTLTFVQQQAARPGSPWTPGDLNAFTQMIHGDIAEFQATLMVMTPILTIVSIVLMAAAVTRRLHDTDKRGYWGLMPLPFVGFGLIAMPKSFSPDWLRPVSAAWQAGLFVNNQIYLAALVLLIVWLAGRSSAGPNRFGPAEEKPRQPKPARCRAGKCGEGRA